MATSAHWILALVEIIYYVPSAFLLVYVLWQHRNTGRSGWFFLLTFAILQSVGSALHVSAGRNGTPSLTAIIIVQVGMGPLILGLAGVVHEYTRLVGLEKDKRARNIEKVLNVGFPVVVAAAIVIYAVGAV